MPAPGQRPAQGPIVYSPNVSIAGRADRPVVLRLRPRKRKGSEPALALLAMGAAALLVLILMALVGVALGYGYYLFEGRIFPGVHVEEIDISGMTSKEAATALESNWSQGRPLLVTNGLQSQNLSPMQLGLFIDSSQAIQQAFEIGRSGSILDRLDQVFNSLLKGRQIVPVISLDPEAARAGLEALAPQMSLSPKDATIRLQGADLVAVPAELGYTINVDATTKLLQEDPSGVVTAGLLTIIPQPVAPAITNVTPALEEARSLLDRAAVVQVYDPISDEQASYPIPRETVASWLHVSQGEQGPEVALDENGVSAFLSQLSGQIGDGRSIDASRYAAPLAQALRQGTPFWVIASHPPTSYTIQSGDTLLKICWKVGLPYWMIVEANPGLNPDQLIAGTSLVIPSKDKLLPLPIVANKRIVISLANQRMWIYQDGKQINQFVISTGIDRSPTQPGIFQVQTHDPNAYASVWDLYMPNFLGIYEAWPGFMNGIHGLPLLSSGVRMWANSLGRPASYGCIILGLQEAKWLYEWAEDGVIVEIRA